MANRSRGKAPLKPSSAPPSRSRSGDFSQDPHFDVDEQFEVISAATSAEQAAAAMRQFLASGNEEQFAKAIAIYVRSAHARGEPIERVLATINEVVEGAEGAATIGSEREPSRMRQLVLRGLLLSFYGWNAVAAVEVSQAQRIAPPIAPPDLDTDED